MSNVLKVVTIASDLHSLLTKSAPLQTRLHSVFDHAINLELDDSRLITLLDKHRQIVPLGIQFASLENLRSVEKDSKVIIEADGITIAGLSYQLDTCSAEVWDPTLSLSRKPRSADSLQNAAEQLEAFMRSKGSNGLTDLLSHIGESQEEQGMVGANLYNEFIADTLFDFIELLAASNWKAAVLQSKKIIGFGPGLTPACDDFLAAIMSVLVACDIPYAPSFNSQIVSMAAGRTTSVSLNMLTHAVEGRLPRPYQQLLAWTVFETDLDLEAIAEAAYAVGSSSGADFSFGLFCGLRILSRMDETIMEGEFA